MIRVGYSRVIVAAGFLALLGGVGGWCGLVALWGGVVVGLAAFSSSVSSFWWDGASIGGSGLWLYLSGVVFVGFVGG